MDDENIEQLISILIISPTDDILSQISDFLLQTQNQDINPVILKFFPSLFTLEHWSWEILSRDTREWHDNEEEYFKLFSHLSSFNIKLIFSTNNIKIKESLLLPTNPEIIDRIFQQIKRRNNDNDRFLSIINQWFDTLALFIHEHIELTSLSLVIYLNERIISDILMTEQFQIYFQQLKDSSPLITTRQLFYIKTSSFFLSGYFYSKPDNYLYDGQQIVEYLAKDYTTIILIHSQTLSLWSKELLACITHFIGLLTACHWWIGNDDRILQMFVTPTTTVYDYLQSLISILNYQFFHKQIDQQWSTNETILIDNILNLFKYLFNFPKLKSFFREQKRLLETFLIFDHLNNDRILLLTYRLQSEVLSEKELKQLNIAKNINELVFDYLQKASIDPLKKYRNIPMEELLKTLANLSTNDVFKDAIMNPNQLTFLMELSDRYLILYEIFWSLTFNIRLQEQLRSNPTFLDKLNPNHTNEQIQKIIHGIQWNLNPYEKQYQTINTTEKKYDIFISYSQKDKLISTQLYNELIANGYHVWINFNAKRGNLIDTMIQAIEQSRTILICMSEWYQRSNSCRAEAQYAFQRQLKIVPIVIEKYYKPDGWLLFLSGNLFSIDFTKSDYSQAMKSLLNEFQNPHIAVLDSLVVRQQPQNLTNISFTNLRSIDIHQWTKTDVEQWLKDNQLLHLAEVLIDVNGLELISLSKLISKKNSSDEDLIRFQEDSMKKTGRNVSVIEIAKLHHLLELQMQTPDKTKKSDSKNCCRLM